MDNQIQNKSAWRVSIGVLFIMVGILGFFPAGPPPMDNLVAALFIWILLFTVPTTIGLLLIKDNL